LLLATGEVRVDGQDGVSGTPLTPGTRIQTLAGQACLGLERSVVVCVAAASEVVVRALGDAQRVELLAGRLAARLGKQPAGKYFGISTRQGTAIAVGTAFAVEVHSSDGKTQGANAGELGSELRVLEGTVRVEAAGTNVLVHQNQQLELGSQLAQSLAPNSAERDRTLLVAARLWSPGAENRLVLSSEPSRAAVTLDSVPLGETPLSVDVLPGMHELSIRAPGYAEVERAVVFSGAPIAEHVVLHAAAGSSSEASSSGSTGPAELLDRARQARQGGHFAAAASAYRELCERHASSAEAGPALLSLAELQLTRLDNPQQALTTYGKYVARGGGLQQEAYYGRIRSLRALGRSAEERREIEAFLAKYPESAYAAACKRRLSSL
jgi:hypothetical protein